MYNVKYQRQLDEFSRNVHGAEVDPEVRSEMLEDVCRRYSLPLDMKMVECHEDVNGEWAPI